MHSLTELIADLVVSLLVEDLCLAFESLTFGTILHLADLFTDTLPDVLFDDVELLCFPQLVQLCLHCHVSLFEVANQGDITVEHMGLSHFITLVLLSFLHEYLL